MRKVTFGGASTLDNYLTLFSVFRLSDSDKVGSSWSLVPQAKFDECEYESDADSRRKSSEKQRTQVVKLRNNRFLK